MRPGSLLAASCAVLALPFTPALAADYDPPIFIEEAPEWVPVEIGSGWYLRGEVSYNVGRPTYDFTLFGEEVKHRRFGGSIGVGYHLSDDIRMDVTASYHGGDRYRYNDGINSGSATHTVWSGLLNGYYDIATIAGVTPYVGAGIGFTYSKHALAIDAPGVPLNVDWADRQYNFAYALMAGAAFKMSDNLSLDVGYQFLHTPKMDYLDTTTFDVRESTRQHQIKVGLRYDLW